MSHTSPPTYRTYEQIETLVQSFEACTLSNTEFNHPAHMTVALWYLTRMPFVEAVHTMRTNIQRFAAAHHRGQLYHETITLFWMKLLRHFLEVAQPGQALSDLTYQAVTRLGDTRLMFRHYSHAALFSPAARQGWLEPDLAPLMFEVAG
jgi:hypothetical protein